MRNIEVTKYQKIAGGKSEASPTVDLVSKIAACLHQAESIPFEEQLVVCQNTLDFFKQKLQMTQQALQHTKYIQAWMEKLRSGQAG